VFGENGGGLARIVAFVIAHCGQQDFLHDLSIIRATRGNWAQSCRLPRSLAAKPNCSWLKWAVKQPLKGFLASFLRPNANHLINREDEDYSVANLSGASRTKDRVHRPVDPSVRNRNFKFIFGMKALLYSLPE
jgi:hypothetical protein